MYICILIHAAKHKHLELIHSEKGVFANCSTGRPMVLPEQQTVMMK